VVSEQHASAYRPDVDGLRAIAVLLVVGFHAFPGVLKAGFIGVDVFFVISGYLISTIILKGLANGRFSYRDFYARRIRRIVPALLVVLAGCLALGWFGLLSDEYRALAKHIAGGAGFISNFLLWDESGYFDTAADSKVLLHLWSLGIEEQFYLIWPIVLVLIFRHARQRLLAVLAAVVIASFAANIALTATLPSAAFYLPVTRFWELALGAAVGWMHLRADGAFGARADGARATPFASPAKLELMSWIGAALLGMAVLTINRERAFPGWWALLPTLGTALIIAAGNGTRLNRLVLSHPLLVSIGLISYPLYLWHWPSLAFARIMETGEVSKSLRVGAVALSFGLAWLTYRYVEAPVRFKQSLPHRRPFLLFWTLMLMGAAGLAIYAAEGLPGRSANTSKPERQELLQANVFKVPYRHDCNALTGDDYNDDWCHPGTGSSRPQVVLVGDSFANSYAPMLLQAARRGGFDFVQFARGQCPMVLDYGPAFCRSITQRTLEYIARTPSITTVVMAARWGNYDDTKDFTWATHSESAETFRAAFARTIERYEVMGKKVVVFLAPPIGAHPKSCVPRPLRLTSIDRCHLPLQQARELDGVYRASMERVLAAHRIAAFDPFKYLCDATECRVIEGHYILTADGAHLSEHGGRYLATHGQAELDALLPVRGGA
jgi:peptidoglycan/LPS O-acetylase OafA/YrhL